MTHDRRRVLGNTRDRAAAVSDRAAAWADRQAPETASGVAVDAWRRYQAVDGPLQSALLSLYVLVALLPAVLVIEDYLDPSRPRWRITSSTTTGCRRRARLVRSVLVQGRAHELGSALLAIAGALFFGLGFGRVLQLVHVRAWRLALPRGAGDQFRYAAVLLGLYGLILLLLVS
jgi:hypothetical protein